MIHRMRIHQRVYERRPCFTDTELIPMTPSHINKHLHTYAIYQSVYDTINIIAYSSRMSVSKICRPSGQWADLICKGNWTFPPPQVSHIYG